VCGVAGTDHVGEITAGGDGRVIQRGMHGTWFSRSEVEQMIVECEITSAQSIAAWALFLLVPQANT
jgi:hypothetical protein